MKPDELIQKIVDQVQKSANIKAILGDPIKQNNLTVIPVASLSVRGGGGGGIKPQKEPGKESEPQQGGMGLGVSISIKPIGYIHILGDNAEFVPIVDRTKIMMSGLIVGGLALFFLGKLLRSRHD